MAKKQSGGDLNLTAMIDLFSTLIIFLLMTAVWNQIEALSTNVDKTTASDSPTPPPQDKKAQLSVTVLIDHIEMSEDEKVQKFQLINGAIDFASVQRILADWRTRFPDRKDIVLHTDNQATYKNMIQTFDFLVGNGWPDVGVNTQ